MPLRLHLLCESNPENIYEIQKASKNFQLLSLLQHKSQSNNRRFTSISENN